MHPNPGANYLYNNNIHSVLSDTSSGCAFCLGQQWHEAHPSLPECLLYLISVLGAGEITNNLVSLVPNDDHKPHGHGSL